MERKNKFVGSRKNSYEPHTFGEVLNEHFASNEPLAIAYREHKAEEESWHPNTHLSVNVKTLLRSDRAMKAGKSYQGILKRDEECEEFRFDEHFTFTETMPKTPAKRNPRIFDGRFITVTHRSDGSYHPNFKPMPTGAKFKLERYALGVYNELCIALGGLID